MGKVLCPVRLGDTDFAGTFVFVGSPAYIDPAL